MNTSLNKIHDLHSPFRARIADTDSKENVVKQMFSTAFTSSCALNTWQ